MGGCKTKRLRGKDERISIYNYGCSNKMNIIILGDVKTGKTSLITRYCDNNFIEDTIE